MINVMDEILTGTQNDEDVAEFLKNLTEKGESDDELLAMLEQNGRICITYISKLSRQNY